MPRPPERPSQLPAERSRMVSLVLEADAPTGMAHHLAVADLYWVTRDMAHAALDASTDIPGWSIESLPGGRGASQCANVQSQCANVQSQCANVHIPGT